MLAEEEEDAPSKAAAPEEDADEDAAAAAAAAAAAEPAAGPTSSCLSVAPMDSSSSIGPTSDPCELMTTRTWRTVTKVFALTPPGGEATRMRCRLARTSALARSLRRFLSFL